MSYIDPECIPTEAEIQKAKVEEIKKTLDNRKKEAAFYLDTGEFRTDLLQTLRGIQDALERISDHLQTN
tara:strand:+ start:51 stop:257 length:207 start_codon:yes stop_codon:yes gene_type:complete